MHIILENVVHKEFERYTTDESTISLSFQELQKITFTQFILVEFPFHS